MRTTHLVASILLWPCSVAAQDRVAVNLRLTVPDFLSVTVERESVIAESESAVTRQVHLRVQANRAWSLMVACEGGVSPSVVSQADESAVTSPDVGVRWRNADVDA